MTETNIHTINAEGRTLGRLASEIAVVLRGKDSPDFQRHILPTKKVKVTNAGLIKLSGKKITDKKYTRHSGYPGNLKTETPIEVIAKKGKKELLRRAVYGMLPANRLRARAMVNLIIEE
ncbi:MAG: 50S ribosomal protein L13 [Patescibacteria group bacterium]